MFFFFNFDFVCLDLFIALFPTYFESEFFGGDSIQFDFSFHFRILRFFLSRLSIPILFFFWASRLREKYLSVLFDFFFVL